MRVGSKMQRKGKETSLLKLGCLTALATFLKN